MAKEKKQVKPPAEKSDALHKSAADAVAPPPPVAEAVEVPPVEAKGAYLLSLRDLRHVFGDQPGGGTDDHPPTTAEAFERLQQALGVQRAGANPRSAAYVDLCFGVLCFARSRESYGAGVPRFRESERVSEEDEEKALLVLTIADEMFQFAVTPMEQESGRLPTLKQCYDRFRERMREASRMPPPPPAESKDEDHGEQQQQQPPPASATLSTREVASFVAFMSTTFFRHLAAYQFVFRHARASVTRLVELCVESPLPPAPLASATPLLSDDST